MSVDKPDKREGAGHALPGGFELLDHTGEVGVSATGRDLREAFAQAARGMFSIIVELEDVEEIEEWEVQVEAPDIEALLVAWLNELIYRFETHGTLFRRFRVLELNETNLRATCSGEQANPQKHRFKTDIKAATYYMLKVEPGEPSRVQVILDI